MTATSSQNVAGLVTQTSSTVADQRVVISAPAKAGQRVYLVDASWTSDSNGTTTRHIGFQDATARVIASATINTSTTVTSSAAFGPVDILMSVSGSGIPADAWVTAKASTSSITISAAATATADPVNLTFTGQNRFCMKIEPRSTTFAQGAFTPAVPIPVSDEGQGAQFALRVDTAARLSVTYGYGP